MDRAKKRIAGRKKRAFRVRKKLSGFTDRPRLCVRRSLKHISAQIVDDSNGRSIAQVSSSSKDIAQKATEKSTKTAIAKIVGELIAEKAKEKGVSKVVFDRKGFAYHGRIKALAEGARAKGLVF
jgi:large subunit ribosomal protein L18